MIIYWSIAGSVSSQSTVFFVFLRQPCNQVILHYPSFCTLSYPNVLLVYIWKFQWARPCRKRSELHQFWSKLQHQTKLCSAYENLFCSLYLMQDENKYLNKIHRHKDVEIEKLTQTIHELKESALVHDTTTNAIRYNQCRFLN